MLVGTSHTSGINTAEEIHTPEDVIVPDKLKVTGSFSLGNEQGTIIGQNIFVTVPFGTDVTKLTARFITNAISVTVGKISQISGETQNDFTSPVMFTVMLADGSTHTYNVIVTTALNFEKNIINFSILNVAGIITEQGITVNLPYGT